MRTKESIKSEISKLLYDLREKTGLSKARMAETLGVDKHTWSRWETGVSSPTVVEMIMIYEHFGESLLPPLLELLYPTDGTKKQHSVEDIRKRAAIHYLETASEHHVRVWDYLMTGLSKPEVDAQIEELCALDHLPLQFRYFLAEHIYVYYQTAKQNGLLQNTGATMPDMDVFVSGLKRTQKAAFDKLSGEDRNAILQKVP